MREDIGDARRDLKKVIVKVHKYGYVHLTRRGVPIATIIPYKEGMDERLPGFTQDQINRMLRELQPDTEVGKCQLCGSRDMSITFMHFWYEGKLRKDNICAACYSIYKNYEKPIVEQAKEMDIEPKTVTTQYVCNTCGKVCASLIGLRSHQRSHNNQTLDILDETTEKLQNMQYDSDRAERDRTDDERRDTLRTDNQTVDETTKRSEDTV